MKKAYYAEHVSGTARYDLPPSICREIGRIITHWAHFEYLVQDMVWQTMQVSQQVGRLAVRDPRVTDRLEMLRDLVKLRNAEWDDALFKSILDRAKVIAARRHLLAHNIWGVHPTGLWMSDDTWHVQSTQGAWPKTLSDVIEGSKKITPEMKPIRLSDLRSTTSEIVELIADLKRLRSSAVGSTTPEA
jgi:hypothetical protein